MGFTFKVASLINSTRVWSLRSSWWLPLEFVNISTPSRPMRICGLKESWLVNCLDKEIYDLYLAGVNNSSHNSTPMQVSIVLTTASPNGTFT